MTDAMTISAQCLAHEPAVSVEVGDINDDASHVICPECGHDFGTWGDVKEKMTEVAAAEARKMLIEPFKDFKGWT